MSQVQDNRPSLPRRAVLQTSLTAGAGLVLWFSLPALAASDVAFTFRPDAFIRIATTGKVTLTLPFVEMGQGAFTAVAMLIAEELEIDLQSVLLEQAPPDEAHYLNPLLGVQATGGSTTMRAMWRPMREAGATARIMLIAAASRQWKVDPATCQAALGTVHHGASGRSLPYGALALAAAQQTPPQTVALKAPSAFRLIGKSARRLEGPTKVDGSAVFGIDVQLPGLRFATLAQSPVVGGRLRRVDAAAALRVAGVRQVVQLDDAVAVVADHTGAARKGLAALVIEWDDGPHADVQTADIMQALDKALLAPAAVAQSKGDAAGAMAQSSTKVEARYQLPFLAHATMEPMNCTAHVRPGTCDVWVGTQVIGRAQAAAAAAAGLPKEKVVVHNHLIGGGFGRRLDVDGVTRAVQIAKHVDGPVKVIWSREEDIQHDMYRPAWADVMSAGLDRAGMPVAWIHRFAGSSVIARWLPPAFKGGLDPDSTAGAIDLPYALPAVQVEFARVEPTGIPTAFWRSVGPSHTVFVVESFMDELAAAAKQDPLAYRRKLLSGNPRAMTVLDLAAEKAGWGRPLPQRSGRGLSLQVAFDTVMAQVAEVEVSNDGDVRVRRVVCAVDCGTVVNPETVEAQVQGAVIFGITAALHGRISIKNGRVEQANFDTYQALRIDEAPVIEVYIVPSTDVPGGMGEPGVSAVSPAIANAIFAATGQRLRSLPIEAARLRADRSTL